MQPRLGIDLGGTKIAGIVLDEHECVLASQRVATPQGDYHATLATVAALVSALEQKAGTTALPVGIGTPGSVLPATGRMRNCNSQCLNDKPLPQDLQTLLQRPVRVANDANCLALSEQYDGAASGAQTVFAVIIGTGTGGGLVVDGKLLHGANSLAGEWGHNPLPWACADELTIPACWCGLHGCLETWLSGPAMSADHVRRGGAELAAHDIVARAERGVRLAQRTLGAWLDRLARALAQVINLLDPQAIVIGGGLSQIRRVYTEVPRLWQRYVFAEQVTTVLRPALHGDASGVRGAARLWSLAETTVQTATPAARESSAASAAAAAASASRSPATSRETPPDQV